MKADDLLKTIKQKTNFHKEIYKEFLHNCHEKIKQANERSNTNVLFTIPPLSLGKPLYDVSHAMQYVMRKLNEGDFKVQHLYGTTLYIDWTHILEQNKWRKRYKSLNDN